MDVNVFKGKIESEDEYIQRCLCRVGDKIGLERYGSDEWKNKKDSKDINLRIDSIPIFEDNELNLKVSPISFEEFQQWKQFMPVAGISELSERYRLNCISLTANALIQSADERLIFHYKNGGARHGSIHTFGGYVFESHLEGILTIKNALVHEIEDEEEIGLKPNEYKILDYFGTIKNQPSVLWDFGTGAIYAHIETNLTSIELQDRMYNLKRNKKAQESLSDKLVMITPDQLFNENILNNLHPQTYQVIESISKIFS